MEECVCSSALFYFLSRLALNAEGNPTNLQLTAAGGASEQCCCFRRNLRLEETQNMSANDGASRTPAHFHAGEF